MSSSCIVAAARNELPFIDEWIAYYHILGFDHIYLYDDDPSLPLKKHLKPHGNFVSVIDWHEYQKQFPSANRQLLCYTHALENIKDHEWVAFLDCDEFIALRKWNNIHTLLAEAEPYDAVQLVWRLFGHNGFYSNPNGLITTSLTRRRSKVDDNPIVNSRYKSITKVSQIRDIVSVHGCKLDANAKRLTINPDDGCINHYMCRSFEHWMKRPERGDMFEWPNRGDTRITEGQVWKSTKGGCLRQFVEVIASVANELVDDYMVKYKEPIQKYLNEIRVRPVE